MKKLLLILSILIFGTVLSVNAQVLPNKIYAVSTEEVQYQNIKSGK